MLSITLAITPLQVSARPEVAPGLDALRDGRFDEAGRWFDRVVLEAPAAPEGPFFQALRIWWRLIDDPDAEGTLRTRMEDRLEESARLAENLTTSPDRDIRERGYVFAGVSRLLQAHSLAGRGGHWDAASLVRKGHKRLIEALALNPDSADALFALGAYDYYADNLPALVKGFRWILAIPGGDETRGIARLEGAADRSALFGTESLMLLAHIYSGGFEEDHRRALDYVRRARGRHAGSPLIALVEADLLYEMGRFDEALARAREAGDNIEESATGFASDLSRLAQLKIAACELANDEAVAALARADAALSRALPSSPDEAERWGRLLVASSRGAGRFETAEKWIHRLQLEPKTGRRLADRLVAARDDEAAAGLAAIASAAPAPGTAVTESLSALLERFPQDRRVRYALGRRLQIEGRFEEAHPHLSVAARGGGDEIAGWALIRLGWAEERAGARDRSLPWYRRAAEMKRFSFRPAARDRLAHPSLVPPEA